MSADLDFSGRVAVVTGAGGGLGKCYAIYLAKLGAKVVVNDLGGSRAGSGASSRAADLVVDEIRSAGGEAVANYDSVENGGAVIQTAIDAFGRVDIVICNAGILRDKSFHKMSDQDWDLVHRVHVRGSYSVAHAAWPYLREQKYGRVIMTSSGAGVYGNFGQANYSMAKLAILGLANTLSREGAKRNILVNTIAPVAASRLTEDIFPPDMFDKMKPEFVAPLVLALCSEKSDVNGAVYELGGGWYSQLRWERTEGVTFPLGSHTPEAVLSKLDAISDFSRSTFPTGGESAVMSIMGGLGAAKPTPPSLTAKGDLTFEGRVAIVTGAGGGLGRTYAILLASRGCSVVVNDLGGARDGAGASSKAADKVVEEIRALGGTAVANYDSVENGAAIVQTAIEAFGRIDIVINNAGILRDKSFHKMTDGDFDLVHRVHIHGAYAVTKAAWPYMREQKYGRIINTSSAAGIYGNFGQANYGSAKLGLVGFTNTLAREGEKRNIYVNAIAPVAASRLTEDVFPPAALAALNPESIAMTVGALVHEACPVNGGVFELGANWVARLRWQRSRGVFDPHPTAGAVFAALPTIGDFSTGACAPDAISAALVEISAILGGGGNAVRLTSGSGAGGKGNKHVQPAQVLSHSFEPAEFTYTTRDLILYALGIGEGRDPTDPKQLNYVYENAAEFQAFPTYGVIVPSNVLNGVIGMPGLSFNPMMLLHGEQYMEVLSEIPTSATMVTEGRVADLQDKGDKGAVLVLEATSRDKATGTPVFLNRFTVFIRGIGNFGGSRGAKAEAIEAPSRAPDAVEEDVTVDSQAALYRLSGDYNPLHIDSSMAAMGGFKKPILHGLCTFGFAARAVVKHFAGGDGRRFKAINVRFAKSVYPGEAVVTQMWKVSDTRIVFTTTVPERNVVVLKNAYIDLHPEGASGSAAGGSGGSLKADGVFDSLAQQLKSDPTIIQRVGKVFHFVIDGTHYTADLKNGGGSITKGGDEGGADCTFRMSDNDFVGLMDGSLDATSAFLEGKVKISGDLSAAQKLSALNPRGKM